MPTDSTDSNGLSKTSADEFLLLCLRGRWDETALEAARAMSRENGLDWDAVRAVVQREGVAPLLYAIARGRDLLPPAFEEELRLPYFSNARRNVLLFHELAGVLRQLEARGISAIVLKGVALAEAVYGNPAVRPMCDADVLVREKDVPQALAILTGLGYRITPPLIYRSEVILHHSHKEQTIELHWSLFVIAYYQYTLPIQWFWQTSLPISINEIHAQILGPEAQLLHLCGHLLLHHGIDETYRLLWLYDIAATIAHYRHNIDWDKLLSQAQACDLVLVVQRVFDRLHIMWPEVIPTQIIARLRAIQSSPIEREIVSWLTTSHSTNQRLKADLVYLPNWQTCLRFIWRNLFPPTGYMHQIYQIPHSWLTPLYYPYRWWVGVKGLLQKL